MPINWKFWQRRSPTQEVETQEIQDPEPEQELEPEPFNTAGFIQLLREEEPEEVPVELEQEVPAGIEEGVAEMVQNQQDQTPEELLEQGLMVRPNLTEGPAFTLFDGPPEQLDELEARLEGQAYPGAIVPFSPLQMIRLIDAVDAYALSNDQGDRQIRVGRRFAQIMGGRVVHETDRRQQIVHDGHELSGSIGELLDNAPVQMENAAQLQPEPETQSQEIDDTEDVLADARQIVGGE